MLKTLICDVGIGPAKRWDSYLIINLHLFASNMQKTLPRKLKELEQTYTSKRPE